MSLPDPTSVLMTEQEAADWLGLAADTLKKWRARGEGPPYLKLRTGTIRYTQTDLVIWAASERVVPHGE